MKSTRVINEIQSKCRICLCENVDIIDIYSIDDNCGKISSAVMECSSIQIEPDDQLPTIICKNCLIKLREAYEFRQLCRLSDQTLRQYINFIVNKSSTEVLIQANSTNILLTNTSNTTASAVAQLICETRPVILKPTNTNIVISTTQNESSTQLDNGISTILTQAINNNCEIMNMPVMLEISETKTNELMSSVQQANNMNLSSSPLKQVSKVFPLISIEENGKTTKFACRHCNKNYDTTQQLVRHETVTHGERKFICNICEHKFTEKSVLKSHMMAKHTKERPHKCQFCDKSYVSGSHLRIHMRIHTGEQPYKCETCEKRFTSANVYKKHLKIHSSLRPYHCTKCPLTFTRLHLLTCHMTRVHDGHGTSTDTFPKNTSNNEECTICKKKFQRKELLRRHNRTHIQDKPYKCSECIKSFTRRWDLNRHLFMHKRQQLMVGPQSVTVVKNLF